MTSFMGSLRTLRARTRVLIVAALAVALITAVSSFAYFTAHGAGSGTALAGTFTGALDHFVVESAGGGNIGSQTTGTPFSIQVTAKDAFGHTVTSFTGKVDITSTQTCSAGCTTSAAFVAGVLTNHSVTLSQPGTNATITATDHAGTGKTGASNTFTVVASDTSPPTASITFPVSGHTYTASGFNAGCSPVGICGAATDPSGVASVSVSVLQASSGLYWNGTSFAAAAETFAAATLGSPNGTSTGWSYPFALPADGSYTVHVQASDTLGNQQSGAGYADTATFTIDTTGPTISRTVVADATADTAAFITQGGTYYAYAQVADPGSGVNTVSADLHTTTSGANSVAMTTAGGPWVIGGQSYNHRSSIETASNPLAEGGNPYGFSISATDTVGNQSTLPGLVNVDNSGPTDGSVDATGRVGTGGRYSTSTTLSIAFTKGTDAGVGLASTGALLQREQGTLSSADGTVNGTCDFTAASYSTIATDPTSPLSDNAAGGISSGHCYRYRYIVSDKLGNSTNYTSGDVKVDTSLPSAPTAVLSAATGNTFLSGTTAYINPQSGNSGGFTVSSTPTDADSGILNVIFPTLTGFTSGGGNDTSSPFSTTYAWSGAGASASGLQTLTATNNATLTNTATFTVTADTANPVNGSLTVNGQAASGAGSTGYNNTGSFTISAITDYTDAGSGLASSALVRDQAPLSSSNGLVDGTCGVFTSPTTIASRATPIAQSLSGPTCYRYTLTGTDNVGNTTSISTIVKVDTTAPGAPSITLSGATGSTFVNGTTLFINAQAGKSGSFSASATTSDNDSGISNVVFPSLTGFTSGGGVDNSSPFQSGTYTWSGAVAASGAQTVTAVNNANLSTGSAFTVSSDTTAPTGGAFTANGTAATGAGSSSYLTTGTTLAINSRTDYTEAQSATASGLTAGGSLLTIRSATLSNNTCGSYGAPTTISGTTSQTVASGNCYLLTLTGTDNVGNAGSISTTVMVDTSAPATPSLTFSGLSSNAFYSSGQNTLYFRPAAGGAFTVTASSTDPETAIKSGNAGYTFSSLAANNFSGTQTAAQDAYTFTNTATQPASDPTALATNNAGVNSANASYHVKSDTTAPTGGAVSVNGTAASAGGTSSSTSNPNFTIATRSDYTETQSATASGLASSTLTVQSETYNGTTCGSPGSGGPFTNATTVTGTTQPLGVQAGFCYLYKLTGTDNVGNTVSISTIVTLTINYTFVLSNPGSQTAGTAFGGSTIQLQANGSDTISYYGTAYTGSKTIAFSGPSNAPDGTSPTYPASVTFTNGLATVPAGAITLYNAASTTLSATDSSVSPAIAGTSPSFTVSAGTAVEVAWTTVTKGAGTFSSNCANTCTVTALSNNQTVTAFVSIADSHGNPVSDIGTTKTVTVSITQNQSGGAFTAPTAGTTPQTLTIPATGAATSSTSFTYKSSNNGNWTDKLQAAISGFTTATLTLTKT